MGRIIEADEIMLNRTDSEVKQMVANKEFDYLRVTLDKLVNRLKNGGSKVYNDTAINRLGDFIVLLPDDMAFAFLKDTATEPDMCERLMLKRDDIFRILKRVRANG